MKIVFFGNTLNPHQSNVADELFNLTEGNYRYIETVAPSDSNSFGGKLMVKRPYVIHAYESPDAWKAAMQLAREADTAVFGACSLPFEIERMRLEEPGITFEVSERWLKRGWVNVLSPRLLKNLYYYHLFGWRKKPLYKLCASAFCASDQYKLHSFVNRCYKWGYFTNAYRSEIEPNRSSSDSDLVTLIWCARFLKLKHPEVVIELAKRLKDSGYNIHIDMYGVGEEMNHIVDLSNRLGVQDIVVFKGIVSNEMILSAMSKHDIFLFTSDRNEGWGAVVNEAMSCGCAVVASDAIGSVPFLIKDGINGLVYKFGSFESLFQKVTYLIEHPERRNELAYNACRTIRDIWSPKQAAYNLLQLIEDLKRGRDSSIIDGPGSKALPI